MKDCIRDCASSLLGGVTFQVTFEKDYRWSLPDRVKLSMERKELDCDRLGATWDELHWDGICIGGNESKYFLLSPIHLEFRQRFRDESAGDDLSKDWAFVISGSLLPLDKVNDEQSTAYMEKSVRICGRHLTILCRSPAVLFCAVSSLYLLPLIDGLHKQETAQTVGQDDDEAIRAMGKVVVRDMTTSDKTSVQHADSSFRLF